MDAIREILLRNNMPHVVYIKNRHGDLEDLVEGPVNFIDVLKGVAELNKKGLTILDIQVGNSAEGVTKIKSIESMGLFKNDQWIKEPFMNDDLYLPEDDVIPFKSDSWALGEFIVKTNTGKGIPKRFLKSQKLLDTFVGQDEILNKLLVLDPVNRSYTWDIVKSENNDGCVIQ